MKHNLAVLTFCIVCMTVLGCGCERAPIVEGTQKLRDIPQDNLRDEAVSKMMKEHDFHARFIHSGNGYKNDFVMMVDSAVIFDRETGLIWQRTSSTPMEYGDAKNYIASLNMNNYAGFNDWRLPTLEEAMSLMEPLYGFHISSKFEGEKTIWTADRYGPTRIWLVNYETAYYTITHI